MKTSSGELPSPGTEGRSKRTVVAGRGTATARGPGAVFCCSVMRRLFHSRRDTANRPVYPATSHFADWPFRREKETMSVTSNSPAPTGSGGSSLGEGLRVLRAKWGWIVALGIIFMIAGVIALGSVMMATVSAIYVIGIMMIMAGVTEIMTAF